MSEIFQSFLVEADRELDALLQQHQKDFKNKEHFYLQLMATIFEPAASRGTQQQLLLGSRLLRLSVFMSAVFRNMDSRDLFLGYLGRIIAHQNLSNIQNQPNDSNCSLWKL